MKSNLPGDDQRAVAACMRQRLHLLWPSLRDEALPGMFGAVPARALPAGGWCWPRRRSGA
jgi:hypothetical protein